MVPIPKAVRVRTASGWQDIALAGPPGSSDAATLDGLDSLDFQRDWYTQVLSAQSSYNFGSACLTYFNNLSKFNVVSAWEYYVAGDFSANSDRSFYIQPNGASSGSRSIIHGLYIDDTEVPTNWVLKENDLGVVMGHTNWSAAGWLVSRGVFYFQRSLFIHWTGTYTAHFNIGTGVRTMISRVGGYCGAPDPTTSLLFNFNSLSFYGQVGLRPLSL